MKIKKDQQKELKKIENCFQQMEQLSNQINLNMDDMSELINFPNLHEQQKAEAMSLSKSRKAVFEISKRSNAKKEGEKVSAANNSRR